MNSREGPSNSVPQRLFVREVLGLCQMTNFYDQLVDQGRHAPIMRVKRPEDDQSPSCLK